MFIMTKENNQKPQPIKLSELFSTGEKYIVPIYQRNYAWTNFEIEQLIDDICSASGKYYLGTLIVNKNNNGTFEVIDGQQRLTTLYLIEKYLNKNFDPNNELLTFEARDKYQKTFKNLYSYLNDASDDNNYAQELIHGYKIIKNYFLNNKISKDKFLQKLKNILIIRIQVPQNIDFNHYFEIMNTRGEQLEPSEIFKAKLLEKLDNDDRETAAQIWEKCSIMNTYIQLNFDTTQRKQLFGENWNNLQFKNFEEIKSVLSNTKKANLIPTKTLQEIIETNPTLTYSEEKPIEDTQSFESIISFQNFLLQINGIIQGCEEDGYLDDKKITDLSRKYNDENSAKNFIYNLLKYRFLFDKYIIKRRYTNSNNDIGEWSLQRIVPYQKSTNNYVNTFQNNENDKSQKRLKLNTNLKILQASLRTTYTAPNTMKWITEFLKWVSDGQTGQDLLSNLESFCVSKLGKYKGKGYGKVERIVFSYLDYILFKNGYKNKKYNIELKLQDWKCIYRTSIEHFSPQKGDKLGGKVLNSFGNLALITVSGNSKFSNMTPNQKIDPKNQEIIKQSLKLMIMEKIVAQNHGKWTKGLIEEHQDEMYNILDAEIKRFSK